jgi:hypothetical protein
MAIKTSRAQLEYFKKKQNTSEEEILFFIAELLIIQTDVLRRIERSIFGR